METFTAIHVLISLIAILSGLVVMFGMLARKRFDRWTVLFLVTTTATSVTGFFFPSHGFTPAVGVGIISLVVLAVAIFARYSRHLAGAWRWIYVVSAAVALYFNVFVLVVQLFQKVPALKPLAPTQSEPPFAVTQLIVLTVFVVLTIAASMKFRVAPAVILATLLVFQVGKAQDANTGQRFAQTALAQNEKYKSQTANLTGVKVHYLKAGTGKKTLVFIHGFGDTSHMWIPLFDEFGKDYTIIAPDMRGLGESSRPAAGYDKKTIAADIHELVKSLGYDKINLVGHDIGLMVAYAYAAQYPSEIEKLALLEAPIPGIGDIWQKIYTTPALWHFHFVNSPIALELVKGRERIFLEHFWQTLSPHPETFSEADRRIYAKAYAQEGAMRAAFEMFKSFDTQDATDNRRFAATKLPMPVLTIEGDRAMGGALGIQAKLVANNVTSILLTDTGHWLMEQRPAETKAELKKFFTN